MPSSRRGSPSRVPKEGESLGTRSDCKPDYRIDPETGCWEWLKFKQRGYGRSNFSHEPEQWAHRAYFRRAYGPIPAGHEIHHKCKNPGCVNPEHLELISERAHDIESFLTDRAGGLTLADVREIRRLGRIQGYTSKRVAEMFGIHWRTVDDYWGSRRWAAEFGDGPCRPVCECPVCGDTFIAEKHRLQTYCSNRCKVAHNYRKGRARAA